jgi:trehalose 6-phosphate synthase
VKRGLIVLANRLPVQRGTSGSWERSPGGLVSALKPVLESRPSTWIGWAGVSGRHAPRATTHDDIRIHPISIRRGEVDGFYHGLSNSTLWPLYHDAVRTPVFNLDWWDPYVAVNKRFALAADRAARRGDIVWIHDFHLQLVPQILRARRPDLRIGFFMHIPFPPEELFAWLPWRRAILDGLLGSDVVGFQTQSDAQNFSRAARRFTDGEGTDTLLHVNGREIRVGAFPISIDFAEIENLARADRTEKRAAEIRQRLIPTRKVLLAVDRLDYTKGIESRLLAYESLLKSGQLHVDRCVLVQIAVPSREHVPDYMRTRTTIEQLVGRINGEFSEPGRVAVHYFRRSIPRDELAAYFRAADVMIVTPLRDGMNLVAKEFVAARTDGGGVLVLSEFAGAARELRRALLVNPRDIPGVAAVIMDAVNMPHIELRQRMAILRMVVRRHDVYEWAQKFLEAVDP